MTITDEDEQESIEARGSIHVEGSAAAPLVNAVLAQTRSELLLTARRGENVLVTIIVPIVLLVFFASLNVIRAGTDRPIDFLLPGVIALSIIATGMVSLGIATGYERYYGVLKRLGASPLPRGGLILAKALSVLVLEAGQVTLLLLVAALAYGWRPGGSFLLAGGIALLGSITFASLGLAMAGALRAEATLAAANGLYLLCLLVSGAFLPLNHLPGAVASVARLLPAAALTDGLRAAFHLHGGVPVSDIAILSVWSLAALLLALRTFKWE